MPRLHDEYDRDEWDGVDYAQEADPALRSASRLGQGSSDDDPAQARERDIARLEMRNEYTADWSTITLQLKINSGYRCGGCRLVILGRPDLLHTHHIDGDKSDNQRRNLRVLCFDCHNTIHGFVVSNMLPADQRLVEALRLEQGTPPSTLAQLKGVSLG